MPAAEPTSWVYDYPTTFIHWLIVGAAIALVMLSTYWLLRLLGMRGQPATGYALIMPWLLGFLIWNLFPFAASLYLSFTDYNLLQPPKWTGLSNYSRLFNDDPNFWPSVRLTVLYAVLSVPLGMIGSLFTAMLLNQNVRGLGVWRTIYYLPAVLPAAATALLWRWMFNPDSGLINALIGVLFIPIHVLTGLDAPKPGWFNDENLVLPSFIIMSIWGVFGTQTVIMLAGLKNIPQHLYEAAKIDGANTIVQFRHVTVPMLTPTLFYTLIMAIIGAMQTFTAPLFIDTPQEAGIFMQVYIYLQAFTRQKMGYASALSWVLLVMILALTLVVFRSSSLWVYYEGEVRADAPTRRRFRLFRRAQPAVVPARVTDVKERT
jgi:multiple sugar transport system permease protein